MIRGAQYLCAYYFPGRNRSGTCFAPCFIPGVNLGVNAFIFSYAHDMWFLDPCGGLKIIGEALSLEDEAIIALKNVQLM